MLKGKLNPGGIFVTQSGAAGIKMMEAVFTPVHSTIRHVFPRARAYNQAVYSFMDEWGWNMGFTDAAMADNLAPEEVDRRIAERITGELKFLDGREARKCTWLDLPDALPGEIKVVRKGRCVQASNQFQRLGASEDVAAHQQPLLRALAWSARRNHGAT